MSNPTKLVDLAQIGLRLSESSNSDSASYKDILVRCAWWKKLSDCPIPFERFVKIDALHLAQELIHENFLTAALLPEFCGDFHFKLEPTYLMYLKNLLVNWKPMFEIKIDGKGKRRLVVENQEKKLLESCLEVIEAIGDKDHLYQQLHDWWEKVASNL